MFESKRSSPAASVLLRGNADNADYKWHLPGHDLSVMSDSEMSVVPDSDSASRSDPMAKAVALEIIPELAAHLRTELEQSAVPTAADARVG